MGGGRDHLVIQSFNYFEPRHFNCACYRCHAFVTPRGALSAAQFAIEFDLKRANPSSSVVRQRRDHHGRCHAHLPKATRLAHAGDPLQLGFGARDQLTQPAGRLLGPLSLLLSQRALLPISGAPKPTSR